MARNTATAAQHRIRACGGVDICRTRLPLGMAGARLDGAECVKEVQGDLFTCSESSSLAHCISADARMGKGIATAFKKKFGRVHEIRSQGQKPGGVAVLKCGDRFVYYLVTKEKFYHKPTYESLTSSLEAMRDHCERNGVRELCMPRIGCGLDKLEWRRVKAILGKMFSPSKTEVKITIYNL